jgi:flagellar protein FlgJ
VSRVDATGAGGAAAARPPVAPGVASVPQPPRDGDHARLQQTAKQLESVFVEQLYKAMRQTVPQEEGIVSGGNAEGMFTGLMDQHLAADTPSQWEHGLADAIYRQLRGRLPGAAPAAAAAPSEPSRALPSPSDPTGR